MKRINFKRIRCYGRVGILYEASAGVKSTGHQRSCTSLPHAAHADLLSWFKGNDRPPAPAGKPLELSKPAAWQNNLPLTPADKVSGYNNFYEFGLDKADPAANAGSLKTDPWTLKISGEVANH